MKKLISVFLVLVLLMSSMPLFSVAEDGNAEEAVLLQDTEEGDELPEGEEPDEPGTVLLISEEPVEDDPEEAEQEEPAAPAEEPAEPTEKPAEPAEEPAEPTEKPAEPTEKPAEPTEKPAEPTEKPAEPTEKPAEPTEKPAEPTEKPAEPTEKPAEPAEKPAEPAEKPAEPAEEPAAPAEEPARFEQGYVEVKKDTAVYADANKKEKTGSFTEDATVYAEVDTKADNPAKDWLKVHFAVESNGEQAVMAGFIQAESMRALSENEIKQLAAKLNNDSQAKEYKGFKLPVVRFEKEAEETVTEKPAEPQEQAEGEVGDNKSALPKVTISAYSQNNYINATAKVSNASGEVQYAWYRIDDSNRTYSIANANEQTVKLLAGSYPNNRIFCRVHVNGLDISSSSVQVVDSPYLNTSYQVTRIGDTCYFYCYGANGTKVSYQWQYSSDGGKTWKNASLTGNKTEQLAVKVTESHLELLYRCVANIDGTKAISNSAYMIAAVASPSKASGKLNATVKFTVKCENAMGDVTYQWQYSKDNGETWQDCSSSGNKSKTLKLKVKAATPNNLYRCIVTSSSGYTVISNTVKVQGVLTAIASPTVKAANIGNTVKFTVKKYFASGTVTYQWQLSKDNGKTWENTTAAGNTTNTLSVKLKANRLTYKYRCVVKAGTKKAYSNTVAIFSAKATPTAKRAKVGDKIKFTATAYNKTSAITYQWQYSKDQGKTWIDCKTKTKTLTANISKVAALSYYYRCKVTDKYGTIYTNKVHPVGDLSVSIKRGNTGVAIGKEAKFVTTVGCASGTVKYTWQYSTDNGKNWKKASALSGKNPTYTVKESNLTYLIRCVVKDSSGTATSNSIRMIDFTLASTKPVYRALLIGERAFGTEGTRSYCARNGGDVVHMASMLGKVRGPGGSKYKVTQKFDLTWSEIKSAIQTTFAGTKDTDVSLFMIASHGAVDPASGVSAGAVATMSYSLYFSELADWFNTYCKGKVIVIIETCGSGSAIYDPSVPENGMLLANAADEKLVQSAVSAFASADPGIMMETTEIAENGDGEISVNTGELRTSKYYVLAAARHQEYSYGESETFSSSTQSQSGNVFINALVKGIGSSSSSPADKSPKNRVITLEEAFSYCKSYVRSWSAQFDPDGWYDPEDSHTWTIDPKEAQRTQRYPKNSKYPLFIFP